MREDVERSRTLVMAIASLVLAAVAILAPWHAAAVGFTAFQVVHVDQDAWTKTKSPAHADSYSGGNK